MGPRLAPGEQVRVRTRAHPRALTAPVLCLMLIALATGYAQGFLARATLPDVLVEARTWLVGAVWILAAVAVLFGCLRPAWRWSTRRTYLTTRRIIQRAGIGKSRERTLHLLSVYDVRLRQRRIQKMSHSGDVLVDHGSGGHWVLANMPEAVRFRELILREVGALRHEIAVQGGQGVQKGVQSGQGGQGGGPVQAYPRQPYPQQAHLQQDDPRPGTALHARSGPTMRGGYRG